MSELTNIGNIKKILESHGFYFSKALGQNFIVNPGICPKIAELGGASTERAALEIGPGIGVLTRELAKTCKKVVAVELDDRLIPILSETLAEFDNVEIIAGDAMKIDLHSLIDKNFSGMEVIVCANLPYYITSPLIMRLLEERLPLRSITVMVQKEAAMRLCAPMPSRQMGAVTVAVQYYAEPSLLFHVSRGSFLPAPEVDSAVIRLDIRDHPPVNIPNENAFFRIVKAAFSQRRKTLANCLSAGLGFTKAQTLTFLSEAEVSPTARAEELSMESFGALAVALSKIL